MKTKKLSEIKFENHAYITQIHEKHTETHEVGDFFTIGRGPHNSIILGDNFSSTRHTRIEKKSDQYIITDLQSSNGTYLNDSKIFSAALQNNDRIKVGQCHFIFHFHKADENLKTFTTSKNQEWNDQLQKLPLMAKSNLPVLICGSSGSGKEMIARMLHNHSSRSSKPYVCINCSALNENLIESELFGHIKGSFTGATEDRKGAFDSARGGTLFLDEIGDLPLSLQPKLLRALENNEIKPVGGDTTKRTDVRVVAATHKDLQQAIEKGEFREDLFYRLNILKISPPDLKNRMEDFEDILYHFCKQEGISFKFIAIAHLKAHYWPGNIRELKNFVKKAAALYPGKQINEKKLSELIEVKREFDLRKLSSSPSLRSMEIEMICKALIKTRGNQRKAALKLGMPKSTLNDRIKKYNINIEELLVCDLKA